MPKMKSMTNPKFKLTIGDTSTVYERELMTFARVIRIENGVDAATIVLDDTTLFPNTVTADSPIQLEVADEGDSYPANPMFKGIVNNPILNIKGDSSSLALSCSGAGYGFQRMKCGTEYGTQSVNGDIDTATEMLNDDPDGLVLGFVNRVFGAGASGDSGFAYTLADVETITDVINYLEFPYKPASACLNDICDLVTALKAGSSGPHWIVTTDDSLRFKLVNADQDGWTKYYGGEQAEATPVYGEDYKEMNFERLGSQSNYILYYGQWRRPSNGDWWTEGNNALWGIGANMTKGDDAVIFMVGLEAIYCTTTVNPTGPISLYYPSGQDAAWDLSGFTDFNTPNLNFYLYKEAGFVNTIGVRLATTAANYFYTELTVPNDASWYHHSLPVGPYFKSQETVYENIWLENGAPDWSDIDYIEFYGVDVQLNTKLLIDGLHFGDAAVCRVAYNSGVSPYSMTLITDDVGKDDSLLATDDTGIMAKLAYAELLRKQKESYVGYIVAGMQPEVLPGQWFYLQAVDYRSYKIVHEIKGDDYTTQICMTDDLVNGRARLRVEDVNSVAAAQRPEFQDRQASSLKAGSVDYRVTKLVKDYV